MKEISDVKQAEIIEAFKSTSRYLDYLLNIDNPYFEGMVNRIYPPELQLNKANTSDTEAPFLDLHLSISNGFVSSKIYDKRDDFDFDIVNFPFLDGDVPRSISYGVYISQLIRFARVSSHVVDFNARNKSLTAKLLQQGYQYHKLRKTFSKFYRRHYELVSKFSVGLKTLLHQGLSEPEFYGDLVYKFKKIVGRADFSDQFRKIIVRYKRIRYNINIMRQSACLVFKTSLTFKCLIEHLLADFSYSRPLDTYLWKQMMKMNRNITYKWCNIAKKHLLLTKRKCHKFSWLFTASRYSPKRRSICACRIACKVLVSIDL